MAVFTVRFRKAGPITDVVVEAPTRDVAIAGVVEDARNAGEEVEVFDCKEGENSIGPIGPPGVTGATGATGTMGLTNTTHSAETKKTRAELNEMTKEELLEEAAAEGVEVSAHWNKADIVDAIVKHKP